MVAVLINPPQSLQAGGILFFKKLSLKECLEMEFQLSQKIVYRDDFNNGVEAVLVKKTKNTLWNPKSIDDIDFIELKNFFEFHTEKLNL